MPEIIGKIVKAKYKEYHSILNKRIVLGNGKEKLVDIISHRESIKDLSCTTIYNYVDLRAKLEIYLAYYIAEGGKKVPYTYILEEDIFIRVHRNSFSPLPYYEDFREGDFSANIRNVSSDYDIDISDNTLIINISAFVNVNLLKERSIYVENSVSRGNQDPLMSQIAVSSEFQHNDTKNYIKELGDLARVVSDRLKGLEEENNILREELEKKKQEINQLTSEYVNQKKKADLVSQECTRLLDRIKELEDRLEKESKRSSLLEVENERNLDEIKKLRKEKNEILSASNKEKESFMGKIGRFLGKD